MENDESDQARYFKTRRLAPVLYGPGDDEGDSKDGLFSDDKESDNGDDSGSDESDGDDEENPWRSITWERQNGRLVQVKPTGPPSSHSGGDGTKSNDPPVEDIGGKVKNDINDPCIHSRGTSAASNGGSGGERTSSPDGGKLRGSSRTRWSGLLARRPAGYR